MVFPADRGRRAGRYLEWKVWIFTASAGLAVTGLYLDDRRVTGVAIVLLCSAIFVRFLPGGVEYDRSPDDGDDAAEEPESLERTAEPDEGLDRPG